MSKSTNTKAAPFDAMLTPVSMLSMSMTTMPKTKHAPHGKAVNGKAVALSHSGTLTASNAAPAPTMTASALPAPTAVACPAFAPVSIDKATGRETYANGYVYDPTTLANALLNGLLAQGATLPAMVDALVKAMPNRYAANLKAAHAKTKAHMVWLAKQGAHITTDKATGHTYCMDGKATQVNFYASK
jgi:hypothetical protein